jgi:hypothetical protein
MSLEQINGGDFRIYRYDAEDGSEPVDLLSVTSIRSLCGESYKLVNWKMANLADAALGTMKRTIIGPRGGVKDVRQVWEYPGEFASRYEATGGEQPKIDELRKWLRAQADEPRNIAALRGTLVHEAIEKNVAWDRIERPYIESAFAGLSSKDRAKIKRAVSDEDVSFVRNSVRHYWGMRAEMPMLILAREVRVVNVTAGYAGTFDALVWMLPEGVDRSALPRPEFVTVETVEKFGGRITLLDWKTSKDIHTDHVVQAHAYLAAEFALVNDVRNERITDLLAAAQEGGLVHIRPSGWAVHLFPFEAEAVRAFLGSVAFARFLAKFEDPEAIFSETFKGKSDETDEEVAA